MKPWTIGWWVIAAGWEVLVLAAATQPYARLGGWLGFMIAATVGYFLFWLCQLVDEDATKSDAPPP